MVPNRFFFFAKSPIVVTFPKKNDFRKGAQKQPPEVFCKKTFLKVSQYSKENNSVGVSFQ